MTTPEFDIAGLGGKQQQHDDDDDDDDDDDKSSADHRILARDGSDSFDAQTGSRPEMKCHP